MSEVSPGATAWAAGTGYLSVMETPVDPGPAPPGPTEGA